MYNDSQEEQSRPIAAIYARVENKDHEVSLDWTALTLPGTAKPSQQLT